MGNFMAKNIINKSTQLSKPIRVVVFDVQKSNVDALVGIGAEAAERFCNIRSISYLRNQFNSVESLTRVSDVIITMLPATKHVVDVFRGYFVSYTAYSIKP